MPEASTTQCCRMAQHKQGLLQNGTFKSCQVGMKICMVVWAAHTACTARGLRFSAWRCS